MEGADSYTAFGYANPARRVLASILHTRAEVCERCGQETSFTRKRESL